MSKSRPKNWKEIIKEKAQDDAKLPIFAIKNGVKVIIYPDGTIKKR